MPYPDRRPPYRKPSSSSSPSGAILGFLLIIAVLVVGYNVVPMALDWYLASRSPTSPSPLPSAVSDAQLRSEMNEFIFRPCIEAAIPSGGLTDMSNAEAIEIGSALLTDRLAPTVLNQVRGESLRENREIYYSNYRDVCIDQSGDMFE